MPDCSIDEAVMRELANQLLIEDPVFEEDVVPTYDVNDNWEEAVLSPAPMDVIEVDGASTDVNDISVDTPPTLNYREFVKHWNIVRDNYFYHVTNIDDEVLTIDKSITEVSKKRRGRDGCILDYMYVT
jgi:hypothetical protein